ncbi:hypothetical protein PPTG_20313, partial [Phytophthora nicotianae INRA-310]
MELDKCVETLHFLRSTAELEYSSQFNVLGSHRYRGADEMQLHFAAIVSPYVFEIIRTEYDPFKSGTLSYEVRWIQDELVHLKSSKTTQEYSVNIL